MAPMFSSDAARIARTNMVECQLRPSRVHSGALLDAMLTIPREAFVPEEMKSLAYADEALKLTPARYLVEPLVQAWMLEACAPSGRMLVVGAGTGYSSALAARLGATVTALEEDDGLRRMAEGCLASLAISGVTLKGGRLVEGCPEDAPYDAILIDGGVEDLPQTILDQLKDGGRLVTVRRGPGHASHGIVVERVGARFSTRVIFDGVAPVIPGFEEKPVFELSA